MANTPRNEETEADRDATDGEHLDSLPDGSGCTEIWDHLSEERATEEDNE